MESTLERIGSGFLYGTKKIVNLSEILYQTHNGGAISRNHVVQETGPVVYLRAIGIQSF